MKAITDRMLDATFSSSDPYWDDDDMECPECESRALKVVIDEPDGSGYTVCEDCGWRNI